MYAVPAWQFPLTPKPDEPLDWEEICTACDWVSQLKDVPQDPVFHAEGDVFTHTRMVLDALIKLDEWKQLDTTLRSMLFFAALGHDIGKPACTRVENGRIYAPRHAAHGAKMIRSMLYTDPLNPVPFQIREYIYQLIRHHGLPLWWADKPDGEKRMLAVSQHIALNQLALLAEADVKGRTCADQDELLLQIELFREMARDRNYLDRPFQFNDGLSRFTYFKKEHSPPEYVPFDDSRCEVILLCGLPGAGKNTWIERHAPDWPVVSLDDLRKSLGVLPSKNQGIVLTKAKELAKGYLRRHQSFIWNATNLPSTRRRVLIDLFTTYKAKVRLVYIEVPYQALLQQNKLRDAVVPEKVLHRFLHTLDVPVLGEAPTVEYVTID